MYKVNFRLRVCVALPTLLMGCGGSQVDPLPPLVAGVDHTASVSRGAAAGKGPDAATRAFYVATRDGEHTVAAIPDAYLSAGTARRDVAYDAPYPPSAIVVDPGARRLYHVQPGKRATRYTVGVGAAGYEFSGEATIPFQRTWPYGAPTSEMLRREPEKYGPVRDGLPGGHWDQRHKARNDDGGIYQCIHGHRTELTAPRTVRITVMLMIATTAPISTVMAETMVLSST